MALYQTNFTVLDWGIVAVYLLSSIVIGIWANRYVGNLSDYLVAGRTLRIRLALASMTGTELGLVTVMYMSELGFMQQYASLYLAVLETIAMLVFGLTGFIVYRLRQTAVMTIPEFYEQRYSSGVRVVGGVMMVLAGVLNMGMFLKAGSQFLTAISGLQDENYLKWIMTGLLLLVLFYTVLGGMVSVVITDLIQFFVLGTGMLVIAGFVVNNVGLDGFSAIVNEYHGYYDPTSAENPADLIMAKPSGVGGLEIFKMAIVIFSAAVLWPTSASRTLSVKSSEVAQKLYLFSTIGLLARRAMPILWGLGAYYFFATQAELQQALREALADPDVPLSPWSAMPLYLAKIIPTGLLGLITAGMVAAFMSTHDSYLLCWSSVITQDIVAPVVGPLSQRTRILVTRISIVAIGGMLLAWGLWYPLGSNLWNYMAITGTVYLAGALPVVVGGLYWTRASSVGAYMALFGGLVGIGALGPVVSQLDAAGLPLNAAHITILAFVVSAVGFVVGSLLFPDRNKHGES